MFINYFASSNPHPPHSRAYDRYNKFLRILETSTPNSHRPLPNDILPRKNGKALLQARFKLIGEQQLLAHCRSRRHQGYAFAEATAICRASQKPLVYGRNAQERAATKVSPLRPGQKHGMLQSHLYSMARRGIKTKLLIHNPKQNKSITLSEPQGTLKTRRR